MRSRVLATLAVTAVALAPAAPASAYDTLRGIVSVLPDVPETDSALLRFMNPALLQGWDIRDWIGVGLIEAETAAYSPEAANELVAIDFSALDGLAQWGWQQNTFAYLIGDLDPDAVRDALLTRPGMEEVPAGDLTVDLPDGLLILAEGEDYATDFEATKDDYPFGGGWKAHRVAVGEAAALVAFAWPDFEMALEATLDPGVTETQQLMTALVEAAAEASPPGFEAYAAAVEPPRYFERADGTVSEDAALVPAFDMAMLAGAAGDDWEAAQIALAYTGVDEAEAAVAALEERLATGEPVMDAGAKIASRISTGGNGIVVAVVSLVFEPGTPDHPSSEWVQRWINESFSGRLRFMMIAPE